MTLSSDTIELFLAVIDHGSFSAAARSLRRVPSAVSMAIGNLEAELGYPLFIRSAREATPTPKAQALLPHARLISQQLQQLSLHGEGLFEGLETKLSLGVASDIDSQRLMQAISQVSDHYPLLMIEILSCPQDDIVHLLHQSRVDLCLAYGGLALNPQEEFQFVGTETLIAAISARHGSDLLSAEQVKLDDLVNHRQIVVASGDLPISDSRSLIAGSYWRTDNLFTAVNMVKAGLGWGNFPQSVVEPYFREGSLKALPFSNIRNGLQLPVYARWLKQNPLGKAAQELLSILKATV